MEIPIRFVCKLYIYVLKIIVFKDSFEILCLWSSGCHMQDLLKGIVAVSFLGKKSSSSLNPN